jgi:intracellular sulfur oxidation DsrE/DsrF family protein
VAVNIFTKTITSGREKRGGGAISNLQTLLNIKEARHIRLPFNSRPIYCIYSKNKKEKKKDEIKISRNTKTGCATS